MVGVTANQRGHIEDFGGIILAKLPARHGTPFSSARLLPRLIALALVSAAIAISGWTGTAQAEEIKIVSEDVLYCPDIDLASKYQNHVKGIIAKRADLCQQTKLERYPEIEDFFGLKFGENEALDEFRKNEYAHYPQLLAGNDLAQVQAFAAKVDAATASLRSRFPLNIQPALKVRSFHRGEKGIIEVTLEAPSQDYELFGELKNVGGAEHLFLTVKRPSDQQLYVSPAEKGPISTEIEISLPLPQQVSIQWRTLMAPIPYDLAFQPLGQLAL